MKTIPATVVLLGSLSGAFLGSLPGHAAPPPAAGLDFPVNLVTQGTQAYAAAAQDTAGNSAVVWLDQGAAPVTVKARRFDAAGAPAGGEIVVGTADAYIPPHVAMTPLGAFAVVWLQGQHVFLRRYDRFGRPEGDALGVQPPASELAVPSADVALDPAGNAFVVWATQHLEGGDVLLQRFDAANQPFGTLERVNQFANGRRGGPRVAVNAADSLLVSWDDLRAGLSDSWARRFDGPTATWGPEARVSASPSGVHSSATPILYPEGDGAVVYMDFTARAVRTRLVDAHGLPLAGEITVAAPDTIGFEVPAAAAGPDGTALVAWQGQDALIHAAFYDRAWIRLSGDLTPSSVLDDVEYQPVVAAGGAGNLLVAWTSGGAYIPFPEFPPNATAGRDGSEWGVYAQRFQAAACAAGSGHLCLGDGQRFDVQVSWKNPYTGETGTGKSAPLTGDTGAFWFFDPDNLEVMIKVLDGRAVNGYFWVFYGSLSNVEYTVTVTDTKLGAVKTYHNAPLQFASRADVNAFLGGETTLAAAAPQPARRLPPPAPPALLALAAAGCTPTPTTLCPQNRFQAAVSFTDPRTGVPAPAHAVTLTDDTGIFWFFDPTNLELMVKVLDGSAINGNFWVFYGGLSDVDYTLTVTDTATGAQRAYPNPRHHLASVADVDAFPAGN